MRIGPAEINVTVGGLLIVAFFVWIGRSKLEELRRRKYFKMRKDTLVKFSRVPKKVAFRVTDTDNISNEQETLRNNAYEAMKAGNPQLGAQLLENAGLLRESVAVLEEAGLIDEACASLMRIQRPARAAAVCSRRGMHQKAAEYLLLAEQMEEAAIQYLEAAKTSPECFEKAADLYENLGQYDKALGVYIIAKNPKDAKKVAKLVFRNRMWRALLEYMCVGQTVIATFSILNFQNMMLFMENIVADFSAIKEFAMWTNVTRNFEFSYSALQKTRNDRKLLALYWSSLNVDVANSLAQNLLVSLGAQSESQSNFGSSGKIDFLFLSQNARALFESGLFTLAAELYAVSNRLAMAAKCYALSGDIVRCGEALKALNDNHLVQAYLAALASSKEFDKREDGTLHPEVVASVQRALDYIDPDNDDASSNSPFFMVR